MEEEQILRLVAGHHAYVAMTRALLGDERAAQWLRGVATIGMLSELDEQAMSQHADVLDVLARLGLDPLPEEVVNAQLASIAASVAADGGAPLVN